MTPERITPNKNIATDRIKHPKKDKDATVSWPKQPDSPEKQSDDDSGSIRKEKIYKCLSYKFDPWIPCSVLSPNITYVQI